MKAELAVAAVIGLAGVTAIGQAIATSLEPDPPGPAVEKPTCTTDEPQRVEDRAIRFAVVGDTVTDWQPPGGEPSTSWVTYADQGAVRLVGGYAQARSRTHALAAAVDPVDADVLVILTGTSDLLFPHAYDFPSPSKQGIANKLGGDDPLRPEPSSGPDQPPQKPNYDYVELGLQRIADRVGAEHVLLSSIPPVPGMPADTVEFNEWLERVAYRHDWSFVDAGSTVRATDCGPLPGLTSNGGRPTAEGARLIGEAIRATLTHR